jgi:hypothetical protein
MPPMATSGPAPATSGSAAPGDGRHFGRCHSLGVIGRMEKTVIDCPDPLELAHFYCRVLGMRVNENIGGWVVIGSEPGLRQLAFQRA